MPFCTLFAIELALFFFHIIRYSNFPVILKEFLAIILERKTLNLQKKVSYELIIQEGIFKLKKGQLRIIFKKL